MYANPTYKQLEANLRLGGLTLMQWAEISISVIVAFVFAAYVSPLSVGPTIFVSIVLAGAPVALSFGAMAQEWSVVDALRAQQTWLTRPRRYLPGPGLPTAGYRVHHVELRRDEQVVTHTGAPGVLWDL